MTTRRRTLYLPVMIAAAVAVACAVAVLALSEEEAQAAFPGREQEQMRRVTQITAPGEPKLIRTVRGGYALKGV